MEQVIKVMGRSFVSVTAGAGCTGCAADGRGREAFDLCMALPGCANAGIIFKEVVDPGPAVQSDPFEEPQLYTEDPDHGDGPPPASMYKPAHGGYGETRMPLASEAGKARATDPQTSHDAAASVGGGKLIDRILAYMQLEKTVGEANDPGKIGVTGKELAEALTAPLNSITPRLAPLRRAGLIHAAGKRDKQIVWKLGNGVA